MMPVRERELVILTPEHVPIRLFAAGLGSRFLAVAFDTLVVYSLATGASLLLSLALPFGFTSGLTITSTFLLKWGYDVWFEVRRQGRTPGKALLGLRVVDRRGLPITFQQSFVRNVTRMLDFVPFFYGVGGVTALLHPHGRRLGDVLADTLVIHERRAADFSRQLAEARRFNSLRTPRVLRRIRHQIRVEDREFLLALVLRSGRMDHKARFDLMEEVGGHYRKVLEVDDPHLSGENLVKDLLAILYAPRA